MATKTETKPSKNGATEQAAPPAAESSAQRLEIPAPNFQTAAVEIVGTSPLMVHRFAAKAEIMHTQQQGSQKAAANRAKPPRDFKADYEAAKYIDVKGKWEGFHAASIVKAMVGACRATGAVMTRAKLALFVEADGYDVDGIPLIRIYGKPEMDIRAARNSNGGVDLRSRPRYDDWHARLRIRFDADMMTLEDIGNLLVRVGMQVGLCELRPSSPSSSGGSYGLFQVVEGKSR